MREMTVEELCSSAENYFQSKPEVISIMAKPFSSTEEAPKMLEYMGLLLSGLHLGKGMTVLDFGAGTCWFSRFLNQLQCKTISCDPSSTALEIGKRLFKEYPIIGEYVSDPVFLPFDGHTIDLPDNNVDRIICYDAFHHIPNQDEVLSEFFRVLKDGGIAGFSEPGRFHSLTPEAQREMQDFKVLENDIIINEIFDIAKAVGFSDISFKVSLDADLSLKDYHTLTGRKSPWNRESKRKIFSAIKQEMTNHTLFFLYKGDFIPDSRIRNGLSHVIKTDKKSFEISKRETLSLALKISNKGKNKWLHESLNYIGTVRIGTHLLGENNKLLAFDYTRYDLPKTILPGETFFHNIEVRFDREGHYTLAIDMVSEAICWFEDLGSLPCYIQIDVT